MPNYFLAKTDPDTYSIYDFEKEGVTNWDGVRNYTAIAAIKSWKVGDKVFIYHSQGENCIIGISEVVTEPVKDLQDERGISWYAKLQHIQTYTPENRVTLKQVKESGLFADFALVRQGRLSTMACPPDFVDWLESNGVDVARD
jgi:predicted RNA-binding protein with PUA-like domain